MQYRCPTALRINTDDSGRIAVIEFPLAGIGGIEFRGVSRCSGALAVAYSRHSFDSHR
jgi:hypothetical protein